MSELPLLEARNISVWRGKARIIDIPRLEIKRGEILSLIGPNGAGKTTLLQVLSFEKPSAGEILFNGMPVDTSSLQYRRNISVVFQEPLLFDTTVKGNVAAGLKIRRVPASETDAVVERELKRFGISHLARRSARTLSGGEAQRTSLARAFAVSPSILVLDEPFASLDPPTREAIVEDLERILRETKTTTLIATHDRMEALRLSDRVAFMNNGRIQQIGPPDEIMNRPAEEFIASFMGTETILSGQVKERSRGIAIISVRGREIEVVGDASPGDEVVVFIRPENIVLSNARGSSSMRNNFTCMVRKIIPAGPFYKVHVSCGFDLVAFVTHRALEELGIEIGKEMQASFKATSVHLIRRTKK